MTDLITQNAPAADPEESKPEKRSVPLILAIGVPIAAAALVAGIWSGVSTVVNHADSASKLSEIDSLTTLNYDTPTDVQKLFANPNVTDFRKDPVFSAPAWKAYVALSSEEDKKEQYNNLKRAIDVAATIPDSSARKVAQRDIDFYQEYLDGGGYNPALRDAQRADAVRLTQQACAAGPGNAPAGFIATWKLDTSDPKPTARLAPNADNAAADATIQKAYVAAMTAGVKHLCP